MVARTDAAKEITDFLRSLRAVRQFESTPVPEDVVSDILEVARWSGSASNQQLAEVVVVSNRATLKALAGLEGYVGHLAGAALAMIIVMPGQWPEGEIFDEGRLSERIMLAALAHGLGSSIGWFGDTGSKEARRLLNVPEARRLRTAISIGYPAVKPKRGRRKPPDRLVHRERHGGRS
jgi:nitroreductase